MKKIFFSLTLILIASTSFGQFWYINFDTPFDTPYVSNSFYIDSLKNPASKWQIGPPQKKVFDSAYSNPNALVTDTLNSVPPNDTSVVIYNWHTPAQSHYWGELVLQFKYKMDGNPEDKGKVEISMDKGKTWADLVGLGMYYWEYGFKPNLKGSSSGWQHYGVHLGPVGGFNPYIDTVLVKFTYITTSDPNKRDGWMVDNLGFFYHVGIAEIQSDNLISLYPNPSNEQLQIHKSNSIAKQTVQILNCTGQVVYNNTNFIGETINTSQLSNGVYILRYSDTKNYSIKKFVVQH